MITQGDSAMAMGEMIAELRQDKGLSQKELGLIINRSGSAISNYENNTYFPDVETLTRIADYFDVTTDYIISRTNYKYSIKSLNTVLYDDFTLGDLLNTFVQLDTESRYHLKFYIDLLKKSSQHQMPKRPRSKDSQTGIEPK